MRQHERINCPITDSIRLYYCPPVLADRYYGESIWRILVEIDKEFVPPLSFRDSTLDMNLISREANKKSGLLQYYKELQRQHNIVAETRIGDDVEVIGFLSFKSLHTIPGLENWAPMHYVTTIGVTQIARGCGVASMLYQELFQIARDRIKSNFLGTRTWHQNISHLRVLYKLGFKEVMRLKNDRGEGIDTVYLACRVNEK